MQENDPVVVVAAVRTPVGRFLGELAPFAATALGSHAIRAALARTSIDPASVDEVLMGCVLLAGQGQGPARQAARGAGLPDSTGASLVNKVCGSGMKATLLAHDLLLAGSAKLIVAGGMESMSNAPFLLGKARSGYRVGHDQIIDHMLLDGLEDAYDRGRPMGEFGEAAANAYGFTRQDQDAYAERTLLRAVPRSRAELLPPRSRLSKFRPKEGPSLSPTTSIRSKSTRQRFLFSNRPSDQTARSPQQAPQRMLMEQRHSS